MTPIPFFSIFPAATCNGDVRRALSRDACLDRVTPSITYPPFGPRIPSPGATDVFVSATGGHVTRTLRLRLRGHVTADVLAAALDARVSGDAIGHVLSARSREPADHVPSLLSRDDLDHVSLLRSREPIEHVPTLRLRGARLGGVEVRVT